MSVPLQTSADFSDTGITSSVTGQVNYGWISEAWRFFSLQMGVWIGATLIFAAPLLLFAIVFYAMMWTTMFPGGFPPPTPQPVPAPGSTSFPAPLTPGTSMNSQMGWMFSVEIGFGLVYMLWSAYLYGGLFRMAVHQVRGLPIEMRDVFRGGPLFGRMLGAILLLGLSAYGLEALCVAPVGLLAWRHGPTAALVVSGVLGCVLLIVLLLAMYGLLLPMFALMADGDGVITALKRSVRGMKSRWAAAAGFVVVLGLLVYASEIPCGVGLLATIPMVFLICALAYRDMIGMPNMVPPPAPYYSPTPPGVWPPAPSTWPPPPQASASPPLRSLSGDLLDRSEQASEQGEQ